MELVLQHAHVSGLLTDQLRVRVFHNTRPMQTRLVRSSYKIFERLRDAPDARIPFARRSEQLNDLWRQDWRIKQRPALIEYGDARLSSPARGTLRHRIRDQHAHRGFEMCIRAEPLHIEKQPAIFGMDVRATVEQAAIDAFFSPRSQFDRRKLRFVDRALHLFLVLPLGEFVPEVREGRYRIGVAKSHPFVGPRNRLADDVIDERGIGARRAAEHVPSERPEERALLLQWRPFPWGRSQRFRFSSPSTFTSITRPPMSSTTGR